MAQRKQDNLRDERPAEAKSAVLYLRVASTRQDDQRVALAQQREACRREAARLEARVVGEYIDAGASGNRMNRLGLGALLKRIAAQPVKYVIGWDRAPLVRYAPNYSAITQRIQQTGASLVFAGDGNQREATTAPLLHGGTR